MVFHIHCSCHTCTVFSITLINLRLTFFSMSKIVYPVLFRTKNSTSTTPLEKKISKLNISHLLMQGENQIQTQLYVFESQSVESLFTKPSFR